MVQGHHDHFLPVNMVGRDIEKLPSSFRGPTPQLVDDGGVGSVVMERRDGVVVGRAGELDAALGEEPDVVAQTFTRPLFAVPRLPLLVAACLRALGVADEGLT
jgi:hypothetical protein